MLKRYSKYKNSEIEWVGEIPDRWSTKPLFAISKERQVLNNGNVETNVLSLSYGRIIRRDVESNFGLLPESFETYNIVEPLDIVLRLTDLQNDKRSLRCGLVQEKGIITSAYLTLEKKADIDPKYMYYLLHNYDVLKVFYSMGGGVRQSIKFEDLKRLPILLPSLEEQKTIASYLDHKTAQINNLIDKKERMIEFLKEERMAIINQAVTKGLNPKAEMKDSGVEWIGGMPEDWCISRLKYISRIFTGGTPPKAEAENYDIDGTIWIKPDNLSDLDSINDSKERLSSIGLQKASLIPPRVPLVCCIGSVGKFGYSEKPCVTNQQINAVIFCSRIHWRFGLYLFVSLECEHVRLSNKNVVPILNASNQKYIQVPIPSIEEQQAISDYLDKKNGQINTQMKLEQKTIEFLKEYRTSLIFEVVTGKIDARGYAA